MKFSVALISLAVCAVELVGAGVLRGAYDGDNVRVVTVVKEVEVDAPHHHHHNHGGNGGGNGGGRRHGGNGGGNGGDRHHHHDGGNGGGNGGGRRHRHDDDMDRPCPQWTTCPAQLPRGSQCWLANCFKRELLRMTHPANNDHFFTWNGNPHFATPNEATSKYGYSMAGSVGGIIACPGVLDTAPLYAWANTSAGTHGYTVDRSELTSLQPTYQQFSVIGYVFEKADACAGLKPLFEETIQGTWVGTIYDMNNNGVGARLGHVFA